MSSPPRHGPFSALLDALRSPLGAVTAALLTTVLTMAVIAPQIWGAQASEIDTTQISQLPSAAHLLGTDNLGRDLFARVMVATRLSIMLALTATALGVTCGIILGALPWLGGPRVGRITTTAVGIAVAFPSLLLALFLAVVFGVGVTGAVLAVGFAMAPWYARVTHTLLAGVQSRDFIAAAVVSGESRMLVLMRHLLPNIGEPLVVNATVGAGGALLAFSGLSFLGLGAQAPDYDWGLLLSEGLNGIYVNPLGAMAPGMAIVLAGLAFNLFGEAAAKGLSRRSDVRRPRKAAASNEELSLVEASPDGGAVDPDQVLLVEDLWVSVDVGSGTVDAVRGVSLKLVRGEVVGLVGESGSGKSLTALAVARLLDLPLRDQARRLDFLGMDIRTVTKPTESLLGRAFGLVFQDPSTSLNPTMKLGRQLSEVVERQGVSRKVGGARAIERLRAVRVPSPECRANQYPYEFSGGMRQRAMIAMAIMGEPALLVADEATTALDVTVQRQVLQLLEDVREQQNLAVLFISHDIAVVEQVCDRILVMYAGRVVEELRSESLMTRARHRYTRALIDAVPHMSSDRELPLLTIPGRPDGPGSFPIGCAFAPRCTFASDRCRTVDPPLTDLGNGERVACWHPADIGEIHPSVGVQLTAGSES